MGLAEVRRAIARSAQADAETVLEKARAEAADIIRATRERIDAEHTRFDVQTKAMLDLMERRETAAAHARSKAITLASKRHAIDDTFATAADALTALAGAERAQFITALCERARTEITVARVRAAPADVPTVGKAFHNATVLADASITGGFVATDAAGTVSVELTFRSLLADVHDRELLPVSAILFEQPTRHGGRR